MNIIKHTMLIYTSLMMVLMLAAPQPAHAQWVVSDPGATALQGAKWAYEKGSEAVFSALLTAGKVALVNVAKSFFQQLAYDSAVYITSGGAGQKPQLFTENWDTYLQSAGERAAGGFVENLTAQFGTTICPPAQGPAFQKELTAGILNKFKPDALTQKPLNKLSQLQGGLNVPGGLEIPGLDTSNISFPSINETDVLANGLPCINNMVVNNLTDLEEQFKDDFGNFNQEGFLDSVSTFFAPGGNDLAKSLDIYASAVSAVSGKVRAEAEERFVNQGYKDTASKIAGYVQTPGSFVAEQAFDLTPKKLNATTEQEIAAMSASESLEFILANTASVFLNTTAQSMIKKLTEDGFVALEQITGGGGGSSGALASKTGSLFVGGKQQAELAYATLLTPRITAGGEMDIVNEYAACPRGFRGINNCVVDQQFVLAVNAAKQGEPLTIKQAIEKGLLHGDWKLYPPSHDLNSSLECYSGGYCYSNLVKLRRARIVPTGFEIAASLSPKQNPWQLKTVVDNFNVCDKNPTTGAAEWSEQNPFCHLIDPNWVLKAPPVRCNAQAFGATLTTAGVNTRQETCVDLQDCPITDDQGRCLGAWGYCVAEKNTWNFNADVCPAQMAGCQLYTNRAGEAEGFLSTTVSHGVCEESSVGCRRYLNVKEIDNTTGEFKWLDSEVAFEEDGSVDAGTGLGLAGLAVYTDAPILGQLPSSNIYFKRAVTQCNPGDKGCTRVIREDGSELYMQIAPNYLGCYDYDRGELGIQLPFTVEQAKEISTRKGCEEFAPICAAEEVGCQQYVPDTGGTTITGIAKNSDRCSAQCVGYNAFAQEATNFEPAVFPKFFIPSTAQQCSFDAIGCDEFTNLDAQAAGGEGREFYSFVRHCEKPGATVPNFYTWEGSAQSGYQIQLHHLKADADGNPAYNTQDANALTKYIQDCNKQTYGQNPDCREIYTEDGAVSYRFLSKTVTLSEDCSPLRRAGAIQPDCVASGGNWSNGTCLYNAIPSESIACAPQYAGCRAYQGNSAADQFHVINDTFESDVSEDFTSNDDIEISSESLLVAGHSLRQEGGAAWTRQFNFKQGAVYTVSFWAKGAGQIDVRLVRQDADDLIFTTDQVSQTARTLTSVWRPYQFGPVQIPAGSKNVQLRLEGVNSDSDVYIDNLVLTEGDIFALIKNSWRTPNACDADQSDNLPGAALGCQGYTDVNEKKNYLKSFTGLCREEAVGCENIIDTRNTKEEYAIQYNTNAPNTQGKKNINPNDNILIGPDRVLRVIMKTEFLCAQAARGCTEFGFKHLVGEGQNTKSVIDSVYLIDDPTRYNEILCQTEEVACEAYTSKSGTSFFKDPNILGKKCIFKQSDDPTSAIRWGWYKIKINPDGSTDTSEPCAPDFQLKGAMYGIWKSSDPQYEEYVGTCEPKWDQCMELVDRTDIDQKSGKPKAYYVLDNDKIDRKSCQGRVSRQEGCVLFDDTRNPSRPYSATAAYAQSETKFGAFVTASQFPPQPQVKANVIAQLPAGALPCNAEVVKAVQDNNAAGICFALSLGAFGGFDISQICGTNNTLLASGLTMLTGSEGYLAQCLTDVAPSNTILKVRRDRQCAAWLSPNSYTTVQNAQAGKQKQVTGLGLCQAVVTEKGGTAQCSDWLDPTDHPYYGTIITPGNYGNREVRFTDQELSGLSTPNRFLPYHYAPLTINGKSGIYANIGNRVVFDEAKGSSVIAASGNIGKSCFGKGEGQSCGATSLGKCVAGACVYGIDGRSTVNTKEEIAISCRGFAEESSPFPEKVVSKWATVNSKQTLEPESFADKKYANANFCQDGQECSCSYKKLTYGNGTKTLYWDVDEQNTASGICVGGYDEFGNSKAGMACGGSANESCNDQRKNIQRISYDPTDLDGFADGTENFPIRQDGICQFQDLRSQNYRGWEGYCLEQDLRFPVQDEQLSHACSTWYPIDTGAGLFDIDNQHESAGYVAATNGGRYWCAQSTENMSVKKNASFNYDSGEGTYGSLNGFLGGATPSGYNSHSYQSVSYIGMQSQLDPLKISPSSVGNKVDTRFLGSGTDIRASELDGIMIDNGNQFFIGADEKVRCYGSDATVWGQQNSKYCEKFAEITTGNKSYIAISKGENFPVHFTKRFKNADGTEDWMVLTLNQEAYDNGNCNQNFQKDRGGKSLIDLIYLHGDGNPFYDKNNDNNSDSGDSAWLSNATAGSGGFCDSLGKDESSGCGSDEAGGFGERRAMIAVNYHFAADGSLQHMQPVSCNSDPDNTSIWTFDSDFYFREQCLDVVEVVDAQNESAVFTQRLWDKQNTKSGEKFYDRSVSYVNGFRLALEELAPNIFFGKEVNMAPYGSLSVGALSQVVKPIYTIAVNKGSSYSGVTADQITQDDIMVGGVPLWCSGGGCGAYQFSHNIRKVATGVADRLKLLFAKPNDSKAWNVQTKKYSADPFSKDEYEYDIREEKGRPPHIASLDMENRLPNSAFPLQELDAFNVNESDGIERVNGTETGKKEILFGIDNYAATIRFSAWADTDQMPLRRIYVDWGDGVVVGGSEAKYKNRKPVCSTSSDPIGYCTGSRGIPNITCTSSEQCQTIFSSGTQCKDDNIFVFGNDPDACEPGFFEYQHVFNHDDTCGDSSGKPNQSIDDKSPNAYPKRIGVTTQMLTNENLGGYDYTLLKDLGVRAGDVICIYKPKVQVKDNWGWCNGTCQQSTTYPNESGCFDEQKNLGQPMYLCDPNGDDPSWTYFGGEVIIVADE